MIISFLAFFAVGICTISIIGQGDVADAIPFEEIVESDDSNGQEWTEISHSEEISVSLGEKLSVSQIVSLINDKYKCSGEATDAVFTDEMGIKIKDITFLEKYTPENVSYSMGYIFAGDKVFDVDGNDISDVVEGYTFVNGRDRNGNSLFEKEGKYYFYSDGTLVLTNDADRIIYGPKYLTIYDEGITLFSQNEKWGAKNSEGDIIVRAMYTYAFGFNEGVGAFATKTNVFHLVDSEGDIINSDYYVPQTGFGMLRIQNGIVLVSDGEKNLVMKSSGAIVDVPADYNVLGCSDGIILLEKDGYKGYMNSLGKWISNPEFVYAAGFCEGLSAVVDDGFYVIDKNGDIIIPKGFDYITDFSDGICLLYSSESGWFIAKKCYIN